MNHVDPKPSDKSLGYYQPSLTGRTRREPWIGPACRERAPRKFSLFMSPLCATTTDYGNTWKNTQGIPIARTSRSRWIRPP